MSALCDGRGVSPTPRPIALLEPSCAAPSSPLHTGTESSRAQLRTGRPPRPHSEHPQQKRDHRQLESDVRCRGSAVHIGAKTPAADNNPRVLLFAAAAAAAATLAAAAAAVSLDGNHVRLVERNPRQLAAVFHLVGQQLRGVLQRKPAESFVRRLRSRPSHPVHAQLRGRHSPATVPKHAQQALEPAVRGFGVGGLLAEACPALGASLRHRVVVEQHRARGRVHVVPVRPHADGPRELLPVEDSAAVRIVRHTPLKVALAERQAGAPEARPKRLGQRASSVGLRVADHPVRARGRVAHDRHLVPVVHVRPGLTALHVFDALDVRAQHRVLVLRRRPVRDQALVPTVHGLRVRVDLEAELLVFEQGARVRACVHRTAGILRRDLLHADLRHVRARPRTCGPGLVRPGSLD
eukprot:Rhum_TRINITY_DN11626_c0_g1::Rhum_TRINITY_DN11626_c0_g1_i1::g.45832::m.45832